MNRGRGETVYILECIEILEGGRMERTASLIAEFSVLDRSVICFTPYDVDVLFNCCLNLGGIFLKP